MFPHIDFHQLFNCAVSFNIQNWLSSAEQDFFFPTNERKEMEMWFKNLLFDAVVNTKKVGLNVFQDS